MTCCLMQGLCSGRIIAISAIKLFTSRGRPEEGGREGGRQGGEGGREGWGWQMEVPFVRRG